MGREYDTIIIGGGASGMMAAISAARSGRRRILVLEKNEGLGRKVLVTGNGRGNLTNIDLDIEYYHGHNVKFAYSGLNQFDNYATMNFFEELGVKLKVEEDGRVFPVSDQASSIVEVLTYEMDRLEVETLCSTRVTDLILSRRGGLEVRTGRERFRAKKVILCAGGCSYPQLGSAGDGFKLAAKLGHNITPIHQALVPLEVKGNWYHKLQGVKIEVELKLLRAGREIKRFKDQLLFTHYGISGPVVLNSSRDILDMLDDPEFEVTINFFPTRTKEDIDKLLIERWHQRPTKSLAFSFVGLLPKKLAPVLLRRMGISDLEREVSQVRRETRLEIASCFTHWALEIKGSCPFTEAMVTAGGIDTLQVDSKTMESQLVEGLFFAGEILDIDGDSGGYNLQFAWSSGFVAGINQ